MKLVYISSPYIAETDPLMPHVNFSYLDVCNLEEKLCNIQREDEEENLL